MLKNISFDAPKGKITALVGSSGSGKSTIISLLLRFFNTYKGKEIIGSPIDSNGIMSELKNFASKYNIDLFTLLTTSAAKLDQIIRDIYNYFLLYTCVTSLYCTIIYLFCMTIFNV